MTLRSRAGHDPSTLRRIRPDDDLKLIRDELVPIAKAKGRRPAAVAQLEKAHHLFSGLGADPYVQACATELAALQVTAATGSPAALLGLSRAELAVARLVATGLTNR